METTAPPPIHALPSSHVASLAESEGKHCWYIGRVRWACHYIEEFILPAAPLPKVYVDLGCGTGGFARALRERFHFSRTILVDGDPAVLSIAQAHPDLEIFERNLSKKISLPEPADLITCMDVFEHIDDDLQFAENVFEIVKPGGHLLVSVPAHPSLYSEWDRRLGHYRRYTKGRLKSILKAAGFEILGMKSMWSFLVPAAPIRLLKQRRYKESMAFENFGPFLNGLFKILSELEWKLSRWVPIPFGTSLTILVKRPLK